MSYYKGLILVYPHGDHVYDGKKTMIIKSLKLSHIIGKPLLLIQKKVALGIIYLGNIITIKKQDISKYRKYHLVNKEEEKEWWKNKLYFYLYPIIKKYMFTIPIPIQYSLGPQVLVNIVEPIQKIYVGTSGYSYSFWKYYNKLEYYSSQLKSIEINNTFYKIPTVEVCKEWLSKTPSDFTFTLKVYQGITHYYRMDLLKTFFNNIKCLLPRLKCLLFQFSPRFKFSEKNLKYIQQINVPIKCAFEFKNESWINDDVYKIFKKRNWTIVIRYTPDNYFSPKLNEYKITSNFLYFRLHGTTEYSHGLHNDRIFKQMIMYIRNNEKIKTNFIYFNNTDSITKNLPDAIYDALKLQNKYVFF